MEWEDGLRAQRRMQDTTSWAISKEQSRKNRNNTTPTFSDWHGGKLSVKNWSRKPTEKVGSWRNYENLSAHEEDAKRQQNTKLKHTTRPTCHAVLGAGFAWKRKTTYQQLEPKLESNGPEFLADMVIEALNQHQRVLEIPVNYFNRSQSQNRIYRNAAQKNHTLMFP